MPARQRIAGAVAFGAAACFLTAGLAAPANATSAADSGLHIKNWRSQKCAAIPGGSTLDKVQAIQYDCDITDNDDRRWTLISHGLDHYHNAIYSFKNVATGKCLTSAGGNGGAAWQYTCIDGNLNQRWSFDGASRLHSNSSGDCLAVPNGQLGDGVKLIHWTCGDGDEQKWRLTTI